MADYNSAYTGAQIDEGIGLALTAAQRLQYADVSVPTTAWAEYVADGDEETALVAAGYTYRAAVALTGVLESMKADVDPSVDMDDCGAGVWRQTRAYNGGIYLYADDVPTAAFTLLTATVWKGVA